MILILSAPADPHARAVIDRLDRRGAAARMLDLSQFPQAARLALRYGGSRSHLGYGDDSGAVIDLDRVRAAWWRSPASSGGGGAGALAARCAARCDEAVAGMWLAMDAQWINPPAHDAAARRDSWQLRLAADLGLNPPQTLITNCPQTARAFAEQIGDVVCKGLAGQGRAARRTRRLRAAGWRRLDSLHQAPAILQERIPGRDVCVTVIGERAFAAETAAGREGGGTRALTLPEAVETAVHAMLARLGLIHATLRFRRATDGSLRFLDIDPAGSWLGVEEATGQPITQAVADHLAGMSP